MLLSIVSAILLTLAFPNFNLNFLVFIGFVPLFFALENKSPKKAFLISYIAGFLFYLGTLYWLYHVTIIGLIILCLYLALYFGIFGLCFCQLKTYSLKFIAIPLIWSFLEYLQSHLFTGFGWSLLGYSQYKNLPLIQIADFSGVYGVSFVIMIANVAMWRLIKGTRDMRQETRGKLKSVHRISFFLSLVPCLLSLVSIVLFIYGYGLFRLNEKYGTDLVKVSVVQGNIPQELKWDPDAANMIIEKYAALTKMARLENPDLVVWPETSFPGFFEIDEEMTSAILNLAKEINIPVLIGVNTEKDGKYFNSALLISGQGNVVGKYDKIHLVPFGEYVPFSDKFPILHKLVLGELGEFTPGKDFSIFVGNGRDRSLQAKFSVLICFEDIFPELSRKFVKNGAKFLVVLTNDAWYGKSGAAYQHAANSVFRAIENRVPVIRSANTGYSCFIDSRGKIYDSVQEKKSHLFITGYKTSIVNIK